MKLTVYPMSDLPNEQSHLAPTPLLEHFDRSFLPVVEVRRPEPRTGGLFIQVERCWLPAADTARALFRLNRRCRLVGMLTDWISVALASNLTRSG